MRGTGLAYLFIALVVGCVAAAILGAVEETKVRALVAVQASGGEVFLGVGSRVLVADESGALVRTLERSPGVPWEFAAISAIRCGPGGEVVVADGVRGEIVRFERSSAPGHAVVLADRPVGAFEALPLPQGFAVADTIGGKVRLVDAQGRTLRTRAIRYPNGLVLVDAPAVGAQGAQPLLLVAGSGEKQILVFDLELRRAHHDAADAFELLLAPWRRSGTPPPGAGEGPLAFRNLMDLTVAPDGALVATLCRTLRGDCTVVRLAPDLRSAAAIADLAFVGTGAGDDPDLALVLDTTFTSSGALLVGSPRLGQAVSFAGPAGPPVAGFCRTCEDDLGAPVPSAEALRDGITWPNGTIVSLFGGGALATRLAAPVRLRRIWNVVGSCGQAGATIAAAALLLALFLRRQVGATGAGSTARAAEILERLVLPDARALAGAAILALLGALTGAALLSLVLDGAAIAGGAVLGAALASRLLATPWLLRRRSPAFAVDAYELHLGPRSEIPIELADGAPPEAVCLVRMERSWVEAATDGAEALGSSDPLELLEALAPPLAVAVRSPHRVVVVQVSALGAPLDAPLQYEIERASPGPDGLIELVEPRGVTRYRLPPRADGTPSPGVKLEGTAPLLLCERCRRPRSGCGHPSSSPGLAFAAGTLFPGAGYLVQRRWSRARVAIATAGSLLVELAHLGIPQASGSLPFDPRALAIPIVALGFCWGAALYDVVAFDRRRARLSAPPAARATQGAADTGSTGTSP